MIRRIPWWFLLLVLLPISPALATNAVDDFHMKVGDTLPYYPAAVWDVYGPVSITADSIGTYMTLTPTGTVVVNGTAAVITNGTLGQFEYRWLSTDTLTVGTYYIKFKFTTPGGQVFTVPTGYAAKVIIEP